MSTTWRTGDHYAHLCDTCKANITSVAQEFVAGNIKDEDGDGEDAPARYVFIHKLYCEGRECMNRQDFHLVKIKDGKETITVVRNSKEFIWLSNTGCICLSDPDFQDVQVLGEYPSPLIEKVFASLAGANGLDEIKDRIENPKLGTFHVYQLREEIDAMTAWRRFGTELIFTGKKPILIIGDYILRRKKR